MNKKDFLGRLVSFGAGMLTVVNALAGNAAIGFFGGIAGIAIGLAIFFVGLRFIK
jgi:hypothetical protein